MRLILYVGFAQPDEWAGWAGTYARHSARFEAAAGPEALCVVVPFGRFNRELADRIRPEAVVLSGFARSFEQYRADEFLEVTAWTESTSVPTLALCGSHQLVGFLYQGRVRPGDTLADAPMRRLHPGEPVTNPDYHPDHFMERGFYPLDLTPEGRRDPLFAGLPERPVVYESHYCEIKSLPPGFVLLASTPECRIQAMRHAGRRLYSVQFHPEDASDRFPDGRKLLENFFRIAWEQV